MNASDTQPRKITTAPPSIHPIPSGYSGGGGYGNLGSGGNGGSDGSDGEDGDSGEGGAGDNLDISVIPLLNFVIR